MLVFTAIHPPGTLGVVQLIASNISDLYIQVGDRRFCVFVQVSYGRETDEPESANLASPVYQHEPGS